MKTFIVQDSFNITGRGRACCGEHFPDFKDYIGKEMKFEGKVEGIFLIIEAEQFSPGIIPSDKEPHIGFIAEEVE